VGKFYARVVEIPQTNRIQSTQAMPLAADARRGWAEAGALLLVVLADASLGAAGSARHALDVDEGCSATQGAPACAVSALQRAAHGNRVDADDAPGALSDETQVIAPYRVPEDPDVDTMFDFIAHIKNHTHVHEDHEFWDNGVSTFRELIYKVSPDSQEYMDACKKRDYHSYMAKSCDEQAPGTKRVGFGPWSVPADAYFCGRADRINWRALGGKPVADVCAAKNGTAYHKDGICGSVGNKQLFLNLLTRGPMQWAENPTWVNVPSLDCLMGIMDCDIVVCQQCQGRCS